MSETDLTAGEVFDSMTGHDEWAVSEHFGQNIGDLTGDSSMWARALVFVVKRREEGVNDDDARNFALDLTMKSVQDFFTPTAAKDSTEGKDEPADESPSSGPSATSLSSVS